MRLAVEQLVHGHIRAAFAAALTAGLRQPLPVIIRVSRTPPLPVLAPLFRISRNVFLLLRQDTLTVSRIPAAVILAPVALPALFPLVETTALRRLPAVAELALSRRAAVPARSRNLHSNILARRCVITAKVWNVGDVLTASDVNVYLAALSGVKSANQVISSTTTFINDADMRFAVAANSVYEFHVFLRYSSPAGADWKSSFTVPAGAVAHFQRVGNDGGGTFVGPFDFTDASSVTSQGQGAGTSMLANFFGFVDTASTAGNLIFQWSANTSNAGNTTLYQNSYITGRRIA
jgi:hypothetical protein